MDRAEEAVPRSGPRNFLGRSRVVSLTGIDLQRIAIAVTSTSRLPLGKSLSPSSRRAEQTSNSTRDTSMQKPPSSATLPQCEVRASQNRKGLHVANGPNVSSTIHADGCEVGGCHVDVSGSWEQGMSRPRCNFSARAP